MTIKVYSSIMPGEPDEVYHDCGMTVEDWIKDHAPNYKPGDVQPVSVFINGNRLSPSEWASRTISATDLVDVRVVPRGGAFSGIFGGIFGAVFPFWSASFAAGQAAIDFITPDIPDPSSGGGQQGRELNPADARANIARLGQGIPEVFGRYIRYPDYANQPRRYYANTTTQSLELMLVVGQGEYDINPDTIKIGETQVNELGGSVNYQIFPPGADVSGHPAHRNWYNSPEVGGTRGGAGLRLKSAAIFTQRLSASQVDFSGQEITVPYGAGSIPSDWSVGMLLRVARPDTITVTNAGQDSEGNYLPDILEGDFPAFSEDDLITIAGGSAIDGDYIVDSFIAGSPDQMTLRNTDLTPAAFLPAGSYEAEADYTGVRYRIDAILTEQIQIGTTDQGDPIYQTRNKGYEVTRLNPGGTVDSGWSGFPTETYTNAVIELDTTALEGDWSGPFLACPEGETTSVIEWDIFAPQGLGTIDEDEIDPRTRTVQLQWREFGTSTWTTVSQNVSGRTRNQLGWTFRVNLPSSITPEVRVRRTSAESTALEALDRLEWVALRTELPTVTRYEGVTTMAMTITGSDQIASNSENRVNLVPVRKLPPVEGGTPRATRSIADAVAYIARDLGYDDDQIDIDELSRLHDLWDLRGDTFDYVFSDGTAKDAIDTILRAGFASMTIDRGVITPVRDEPRTQLEDGYSPENMTAPLRRQFTARQPDEPDGVEVEYTNGTTWTKETVLCLLPGDQQIKLDKISLEGVTDRTKAWRIGMRRRRAQRYRRWTYTFNTELDALNSNYLSYVPLIDDIPGYGKVAILTSISEDRITVSEPLEWQQGQSHVIAYRDENGDTVGPFRATQGPDDYTIFVEIPQPWPAVLPSDREQTHIYFGTTERWHFPALITEISPSGPLQVGVTATNYDDRVYSDDNSSPL